MAAKTSMKRKKIVLFDCEDDQGFHPVKRMRYLMVDSEDEPEVHPVKRKKILFDGDQGFHPAKTMTLMLVGGEDEVGVQAEIKTSCTPPLEGSPRDSSQGYDQQEVGQAMSMDQVKDMVNQMYEAFEEDRFLQQKGMPALEKTHLLPQVLQHLRNPGLVETFVQCGVVRVMAAWLRPLPDRSLPDLQIRTEIFKILMKLPKLSAEEVKYSGIGPAVTFLRNHKLETAGNKERADHLTVKWMQVLFGVWSDSERRSPESRHRAGDPAPTAARKRFTLRPWNFVAQSTPKPLVEKYLHELQVKYNMDQLEGPSSHVQVSCSDSDSCPSSSP